MEDNPIPLRLKQARKRAGITQKHLGVMIGMEESSASGRMNHYEKGRHVPDISTLRKLATALEVPMSYFFCEDDLSAELAIKIEKLPKTEKEKLLQFIENLQQSNE
ncbi:helix-turn-helix domain-containing protein [Shewanella sp. C32]|uniref:Helix-turn-helix domain-containing protein n=1 Tax=Shewanella electrica TaxID=515560 RepID=A0ABT2FLH1_9GAMM|nr:helix-turn-helix transcriptional regulator [Shewanella electrica]MCH1924163.1 helix-turn-helix domain-containing protein [Shewanella electrica]MCS4556066.1 helix-turn-helix domain-containing protein [Shewanella electrica]